jgi:hypothetical protein
MILVINNYLKGATELRAKGFTGPKLDTINVSADLISTCVANSPTLSKIIDPDELMATINATIQALYGLG